MLTLLLTINQNINMSEDNLNSDSIEADSDSLEESIFVDDIDIKRIMTVINFFNQVIGKEKKIKLDSNIYDHVRGGCDYSKSKFKCIGGLSGDIYNIIGTDVNGYISYEDMSKVFKKIRGQFSKMKKNNISTETCMYEDIVYDEKGKMWYFSWGT